MFSGEIRRRSQNLPRRIPLVSKPQQPKATAAQNLSGPKSQQLRIQPEKKQNKKKEKKNAQCSGNCYALFSLPNKIMRVSSSFSGGEKPKKNPWGGVPKRGAATNRPAGSARLAAPWPSTGRPPSCRPPGSRSPTSPTTHLQKPRRMSAKAVEGAGCLRLFGHRGVSKNWGTPETSFLFDVCNPAMVPGPPRPASEGAGGPWAPVYRKTRTHFKRRPPSPSFVTQLPPCAPLVL